MGLNKQILENEVTLDFLRKNIGAQAVPVIKYYARCKKDLRDDILAERFKVKVTEIRTTLNRFHYWGIAEYDKKRNKKTGWYTYTWRINENRIIELLLQEQQDLLRKLEAEQNNLTEYTMFSCKKKCENLAFEIAIQYNFQCQICGEKMDEINEKTRQTSIKKQITKLNEFIEKLVKKDRKGKPKKAEKHKKLDTNKTENKKQ